MFPKANRLYQAFHEPIEPAASSAGPAKLRQKTIEVNPPSATTAPVQSPFFARPRPSPPSSPATPANPNSPTVENAAKPNGGGPASMESSIGSDGIHAGAGEMTARISGEASSSELLVTQPSVSLSVRVDPNERDDGKLSEVPNEAGAALRLRRTSLEGLHEETETKRPRSEQGARS